jgi:hypothetical protein
LVELAHLDYLPSSSSFCSLADRPSTKQTPGALFGLPKNSTPAASNAAFSANMVLTWPDGTPCIDSILLIVALPTPDFSAKSPELHRSNALAARI